MRKESETGGTPVLLFFTLPPCPLLPHDFTAQQLFSGPSFALSVFGERKEFFGQRGPRQARVPRTVRQQPSLACFLHKLVGAEQGRQMFRDAVERRRPRMPRAVFFRFLNSLPVRP